jgi:hypothetical protein
MFLVISYLDAVAIVLMALPIGTYAEIYIFLQAHAPQIYIFFKSRVYFFTLSGWWAMKSFHDLEPWLCIGFDDS